MYHFLKYGITPYNREAFSGSCYSGIQKIAGIQQFRAGKQRNNYRRIFTSLRFVDCYGIRQLQLFGHVKTVFHFSGLIKFYFQCFCILIDFCNNPHVTVKYSGSFIDSQTELCGNFPFELVIVFNLHYLIAHPEQSSVYLPLCPAFLRRIQIPLEDSVQSFYSQKTFPCRCHHLNFIGMSMNISGQLFLNQHDDNPDNCICILPPQEEKVPAFIIQNNRLSGINLMSIHYNVTFSRLTENPGKDDHREPLRRNNIFQHTARPHRRELVHIPHQNQPGSRHNCRKKGVHKGQVNH